MFICINLLSHPFTLLGLPALSFSISCPSAFSFLDCSATPPGYFSWFYFITSSGWVILPVTALAAATAGLDRYTSDFALPMRPTKLRLVVDTHRSPSARTPICPPRHGPQVGVLTTAPALINISIRPSARASR